MAECKNVLSVGIDIGTTTTSMIVSRMEIENTAMSYMVPSIGITKKEIIYKSPIYFTPIIDEETLDGDKIREIIEKEYKSAGIRPEQIEAGAVMITGESARKSNAEIITGKLSEFAGDFVVATAGPNLESIIAGKGSGAKAFSQKYGVVIANLDIGGGTTNISVFNCGELVGYCCIDIGGRLIRYDDNKTITYVSKRFNDLGALRNIYVTKEMKVNERYLKMAAKLLVDGIADTLKPERTSLGKLATTNNSAKLSFQEDIEYLSFSGGIGECYYSKEDDLYKYGDLGVALARELRENEDLKRYVIVQPEETIRATVVGAGVYTAEVSGSTISYSDDIFPLKNVSVFKFGENAEKYMYHKNTKAAETELEWFLKETDEDRIAFSLEGLKRIDYGQIQNLADCLLELDEKYLDVKTPLIILIKHDMAKALGQIMERKNKNRKSILCLDKIYMDSGDYIDVGKPILDGIAVPIVIKTLVFK